MRVVVKVGGAVALAERPMAELLHEMPAGEAANAVLVHGGGAMVTEFSRRLGLEPRFVDGIRMTSEAEMEVVDMVLAGRMNTELVRLAIRAGCPAVGLTGADGSLFEGRPIAPGSGNRTATVSAVNPAAVEALWAAGFLPVVASVGVGSDGAAVNINADDAAQALAEQLAVGDATALVFLSDTAGVLDAAGGVIEEIQSAEVEALIGSGVVGGGMTAKIRSCARAVERGVNRVVVGTYHSYGDLAALIDGRSGTTIRKGASNE